MFVHRADNFRVTEGVNLDDPLTPAEDLSVGDVYQLHNRAEPQRLTLATDGSNRFVIAPASGTGTPGNLLHLDSAATFMSQHGAIIEAVILAETDAAGHVWDVFVMSQTPLQPRQSYTLIGINTDRARDQFAATCCTTVARGTRLTLATGERVGVEALRPGDRLATHDDGVAEIRWIGQSTLRATGASAPIIIRANALGNSSDLVVGPEHQLFLSQSPDATDPVDARSLVDGNRVIAQQGGFLETFQILLDQHHAVFAEGVAMQSRLIDPLSRPVLPPEAYGNITPIHSPSPAPAAALIGRPSNVIPLRGTAP